ncbi:MAG: serine/threonine-protein kinase [Polyangiales bacterium]
MPAAGEIIGGKYRILGELGAGGMGVVLAARHVDTERQVALKWLSPALSHLPEAAARFKREAKAAGRILHPNVVAVHDCSEHEGQLYLVMEQLVGRTLRATMARAGGKLPPADAFGVLFPVLRGVAAAHAAGVLHRDLKPENVLLADSPDGLEPMPKVLDFGLAKLRDAGRKSQLTQLTAPAALMGTYQYMAPEQLRGRDDLDERVDVYALGVMLYEMLTGVLPYAADNPVDLALQVLESEPVPLSAHDASLSPALGDVVARALARDRAERFASVEAFALALAPLSGSHAFRGPHASTSSHDPRAADFETAPTVALTPPAPVPAPRRMPRTSLEVLRTLGVPVALAALLALGLALRTSVTAERPAPLVPSAPGATTPEPEPPTSAPAAVTDWAAPTDDPPPAPSFPPVTEDAGVREDEPPPAHDAGVVARPKPAKSPRAVQSKARRMRTSEF